MRDQDPPLGSEISLEGRQAKKNLLKKLRVSLNKVALKLLTSTAQEVNLQVGGMVLFKITQSGAKLLINFQM